MDTGGIGHCQARSNQLCKGSVPVTSTQHPCDEKNTPPNLTIYLLRTCTDSQRAVHTLIWQQLPHIQHVMSNSTNSCCLMTPFHPAAGQSALAQRAPIGLSQCARMLCEATC
jgi:hypothetical protein